jgi:hypothetical protein
MKRQNVDSNQVSEEPKTINDTLKEFKEHAAPVFDILEQGCSTVTIPQDINTEYFNEPANSDEDEQIIRSHIELCLRNGCGKGCC